MHDSTVYAIGFFPSATTRQTISLSVTTPIGCSVASTTGISPQSFATMSLATSSSVAFGPQHAGFGVMTSRASFVIVCLLCPPQPAEKDGCFNVRAGPTQPPAYFGTTHDHVADKHASLARPTRPHWATWTGLCINVA